MIVKIGQRYINLANMTSAHDDGQSITVFFGPAPAANHEVFTGAEAAALNRYLSTYPDLMTARYQKLPGGQYSRITDA